MLRYEDRLRLSNFRHRIEWSTLIIEEMLDDGLSSKPVIDTRSLASETFGQALSVRFESGSLKSVQWNTPLILSRSQGDIIPHDVMHQDYSMYHPAVSWADSSTKSQMEFDPNYGQFHHLWVFHRVKFEGVPTSVEIRLSGDPFSGGWNFNSFLEEADINSRTFSYIEEDNFGQGGQDFSIQNNLHKTIVLTSIKSSDPYSGSTISLNYESLNEGSPGTFTLRNPSWIGSGPDSDPMADGYYIVKTVNRITATTFGYSELYEGTFEDDSSVTPKIRFSEGTWERSEYWSLDEKVLMSMTGKVNIDIPYEELKIHDYLLRPIQEYFEVKEVDWGVEIVFDYEKAPSGVPLNFNVAGSSMLSNNFFIDLQIDPAIEVRETQHNETPLRERNKAARSLYQLIKGKEYVFTAPEKEGFTLEGIQLSEYGMEREVIPNGSVFSIKDGNYSTSLHVAPKYVKIKVKNLTNSYPMKSAINRIKTLEEELKAIKARVGM